MEKDKWIMIFGVLIAITFAVLAVFTAFGPILFENIYSNELFFYVSLTSLLIMFFGIGITDYGKRCEKQRKSTEESKERKLMIERFIAEIKNGEAWNILINYFEKYDNKPFDEIEKLHILLKKNYDIDVNKDIFEEFLDCTKKEVNKEKKEREYRYFKKTILSEKPKTKEEYGDVFLKHYGKKYHTELDKFRILLVENGFNLDQSSTTSLIEGRKRYAEIKHFEHELLDREKPGNEYQNKLVQIKRKIQKWEKEGYDVSELEKLLKEVK